MSFAAPLWLAAAAAVGVGVIIAHLFSTSVPPRNYLPTVRFVPEGAPLAVLRTRRISDVALLLLRLLAVALLGLALAGIHVRRGGPRRVVVVDVSRAVGSVAELRDSVRAHDAGGVFVAFDSIARRVTRDSLNALEVSTARGSISAALVAAQRAIATATDDRDSVELILVSPVVREELDSATSRLLALWEGPVRVVRVGAATAPPASRPEVRALGDDPVAAALGSRLSALGGQRAAVRLVRTNPTRADSVWARDSAGVLVVWPSNAANVLVRRQRADSPGGVATSHDVVIAEFAREYEPHPGHVVVRWIDGSPAATEMPLGRGCVREVAIPVDAVGDVALRESFRGIAATLLEPCAGARDFQLSALGPRPSALSPASREPSAESREPLWVALLALGVLLSEQLLRTRRRAPA